MLPCLIPGIEAVQAQSRHRFGRHMHEQFGIGVVLQGGQKSLSGRGVVEAMAGDTITVNPGEIHDGTPISDAGRSWKMLYLEPALIAALRSDISEGKSEHAEFTLPVIADTRTSRQVQDLFACMTTPGNKINGVARMAAEEAMLLLFAKVMHVPAGMHTVLAIPQAIAHARTRIDDDPTAALTLHELAQESGLSRFQLVRAFARATGMTPHAYLLQRRLHHARRLIAGGTPLVQAAAHSGFADQSHMTRLFIRNFGLSPGIYASALT
ncbi:AraC family transcriptional regulator [Undibacterium sp. CY18W]|uniref:AraC family transcriptional regulator n=2 Tax=Undibacterium hunanense TaxID=2762292 RepID=A0ABR6ZZ36_9BURK|nr:AraC family transcriptional regulator [Undibacterium hunanense]